MYVVELAAHEGGEETSAPVGGPHGHVGHSRGRAVAARHGEIEGVAVGRGHDAPVERCGGGIEGGQGAGGIDEAPVAGEALGVERRAEGERRGPGEGLLLLGRDGPDIEVHGEVSSSLRGGSRLPGPLLRGALLPGLLPAVSEVRIFAKGL